jgi:hypothetical protein
VENNRYFGSKSFVEKMKEALGYRATGRKIICANDIFELREGQTSYGEASDLDSGNTFLWDQQPSPLIRFRINVSNLKTIATVVPDMAQ